MFERGWLSSNGILFDGPHGTALVDSGYSSHSPQIVALVAGALGSRELDLLLNTHLHSDHCGGNAAIQLAYPRLRTMIPPGLSEFVRDWDPVALSYTPTGQQCPRFEFDGLLIPGEEAALGDSSWQIHSAPGHDPHSVILFEPATRTLVSADALWQNGFGIVFEELEGVEAFDEVAATLDLIESLRPRAIIPGHGGVFADVAGALSTARSRLDGFVRDPVRHARHAAKVLLKFKLLELQEVRFRDLQQWAVRTPYFALLLARYFGDREPAEWTASLAGELVKSGAARMSGDMICNA